MFPGAKVKIGEEEFIVPAVSLGQLRAGLLETMRQHDELIAEGKTFDAVLLRGEVILAAVRRNYPDFPADKLFDFLDMQNSGQLWLQILGASGFAPGEDQAATKE